MSEVSSYILQYLNSNFGQMSSSPYDLIITQGAQLPRAGSLPQFSDVQVQQLIAQGRIVVGYVSISVAEDYRSYWENNGSETWTDDHTDLGDTSGQPQAPEWLTSGLRNSFGIIAKFDDAAWRQIVIDQALDLLGRGYSGIFLDDLLSYFILGLPTQEISNRATLMAETVDFIVDAIHIQFPNAIIVANSNPYLPTDVTADARGQAAAAAFLNAVDFHLLENPSRDAFAYAQQTFANEQVLYLFSNGNPSASNAEAWANGVPFYAINDNYGSYRPYVGPGTGSGETIVGGDGPNQLSGLGGDDVLNGGLGNDVLIGGAGNDTLAGGAGANQYFGGTGNDVYVVTATSTLEAAQQTLFELVGEGLDEVRVSSSVYSLEWYGASDLENLTLTDTGAHSAAIGNALANFIQGNTGMDDLFGRAGNDTLRGGTGAANTMLGQEGDDVYIVDAVGDSVIEFANEGVDSVRTSLSAFVLRNHVENLTYTGGNAFTGIGAENDNALIGGLETDFLSGLNGNDILFGRLGSDELLGGAGADQFRYAGDETGIDRIYDFTSGQDKIALSVSGFVRIATVDFRQGVTPVATSANSTFLYNVNNGIVSYDADGTGAGAAIQLAQLNAGLTLSAGDFIFY